MFADCVLYSGPCSMSGRISTKQFGPNFELVAIVRSTPGRSWIDGGSCPVRSWYEWQAMANWCRLLEHLARAADSRTFWTAGRSRPIRIAMIAITTRSSINVKPRYRRERDIGTLQGNRENREQFANPG